VEISGELYDFIVRVVEDKVKDLKVQRREYEGLVKAIDRLAEAQEKTEEQLGRLVEAQRRTEERLNKLVEAQERTEERLNKLAEAQAKTEERLNKLAEAQTRTEKRVNMLAQAQAKTEERLSELALRVDQLALSVERLVKGLEGLRIEVGRLSETIGFGLEDVARVVLPSWLYRHHEIEVEDLRREFLLVDGREVKVDLYGRGKRRGRDVTVIGEVKSRIYGRDVDEFHEKLKEIKKTIKDTVIPVMFGYLIHPSTKDKAEKLGILLVASHVR